MYLSFVLEGSSDPMPVLIDVRGGVHYLVEDRPALMASHGFATFSLNYFRKMVGENQVWSDDVSHFDLQIFVVRQVKVSHIES